MKKIWTLLIFLIVSLSLSASDMQSIEDDNFEKVFVEQPIVNVVTPILKDSVEKEEDSNSSSENKMLYDNQSYDPENYIYTLGLIPPEKLKIGAASHLYAESAMLYGYPAVGGSWDFGINVDTVSIALYTRLLHFFKPLGSSTGNLAVAEELTEIGLSFKVRMYELGRFNVNIGINTGWYQQWLMFGSNAGTYNLINNGLMIRPEASIGWNWIGWWNMELGLFYQTPLYPVYSGYEGWGVFIKIV